MKIEISNLAIITLGVTIVLIEVCSVLYRYYIRDRK